MKALLMMTVSFSLMLFLSSPKFPSAVTFVAIKCGTMHLNIVKVKITMWNHFHEREQNVIGIRGFFSSDYVMAQPSHWITIAKPALSPIPVKFSMLKLFAVLCRFSHRADIALSTVLWNEILSGPLTSLFCASFIHCRFSNSSKLYNFPKCTTISLIFEFFFLHFFVRFRQLLFKTWTRN